MTRLSPMVLLQAKALIINREPQPVTSDLQTAFDFPPAPFCLAAAEMSRVDL